jgi:hypothetical protein
MRAITVMAAPCTRCIGAYGQEDIELLKLHKLDYDNGKGIVGEFTSVWHPNHADISSGDYLLPITSLT